MRLSIVGVVAVALAGCSASVRERADKAMSRGDYRQAAELYDRVVLANPKDQGAIAKRTEARHGVLRQIFVHNQNARRANDRATAIKHLGELLAQRDDWRMDIEPRYANALAAEVGMAGQDIAIDVDHATHTIGPLAGEHALVGHAELLARADFGGRGNAIHAKVRVAGLTWCTRLSTDATTPYWAWMVDRYCTHWGDPDRVAAPPLPDLRGGLLVDGEITGHSKVESTALREAMAAAFRDSVWYSPTASVVATANVSGHVAIAFASKPVTLHTTWDEEVPYTDYETTQESYQEPYSDTETYTEQVPYTDTETKTETCDCIATRSGTGHDCMPRTCTRTETVTKYRSETRTRTVTKYRTAWRTVTNEVTKYRTETHPYSYSATEITGNYSASLQVRLVEPASAGGLVNGVVAQVELSDRVSGIDHDVTFGPAGITPVRANLPTREYVVDRERGRLQVQLRTLLDNRFAALFCAAATFDKASGTVDRREAAARCAYLDHASAPGPVHAVLQTVFGGDERFLGAVLARAPWGETVATQK